MSGDGGVTVHTAPLGSVVEVTWFDSERVFLGWASVEDYTKALVDRSAYRTAGYLVNVTTDHALICLNRNHDRTLVGECMVIPIVCIATLRVFKS